LWAALGDPEINPAVTTALLEDSKLVAKVDRTQWKICATAAAVAYVRTAVDIKNGSRPRRYIKRVAALLNVIAVVGWRYIEPAKPLLSEG
jgi:hypothetical protein